ncbi:MAG TPA: hypothetical protein VGR90_09630 [Acidimicrobiales bacterium]|nr:hypothetical protein [Acidimicrobiales bacterium]
MSRRRFLGRGSLTMAAATAAATAPAGLVPVILTAGEDAPLTEDEISAAAGSGDGVLIAHIRDLANGEISVFSGTQEVVIRDPRVAARIARAVQ